MRLRLLLNPGWCTSTVRRYRRALFVCATTLLLSGCFQTQLNGPVGGAQVSVAPLDNPDQVIATAESWDREYMENNQAAAWAGANAFIKLFWIGNFQLQLLGLDDNAYYLVTASGGEDVNADRNSAIDNTYTPVQGQWHALMSGAELKEIGPKVSGLTEAVYQWIKPLLGELSSAQIAYNLDRAARQVVVDISNDGQVTWLDALIWSRQLPGGPFIGDLNAVNQISDNVTANGTESERASLGLALIGFDVTTEVEDTPFTYYSDFVADAVVVCQACHIPGGIAVNGGARLSLGPTGTDDATNAAALDAFLTEVDGAPQLILSKAQGVGHGGGPIYTSQSNEYQALANYVFLVTGEQGDIGGPEGDFWNGLIMADARQTLRRAALIFAGRLPTEAEYAQAEAGADGLRAALLGLMEGEEFHEFLIRAANDRLHTDGLLNGLFFDVLDSNWTFYPLLSQRKFDMLSAGQEEEYWEWERLFQYGAARSPLELIAYVVENNLPYSEILTADYMMSNPQMSYVFRTGANHGTEDPDDFRRTIHKGQIFQDESLVSEYIEGLGANIFQHGSFLRYPHAGVLNSMAFLTRYPSTETNRNRARARWTYLHFLDVDIEKSASRTTDPAALADTNNPTMNNPACTVCHEQMDPVAGAFQNYGNEGWYRSSWGGKDALPDTYKYPEWFSEDADPSPYREGDTWFRDMRAPGLPGEATTRKATTLQWLAGRIASDPRFARASVKFWWPAVMGAEVLEAPGSTGDVGYQQLLRAFDQQNQDIQNFAEDFSDGGLKLKSLLVDMAMSGWFRAAGVEPGAAAGRELELEVVGTGRLLTPEELTRKTRAIFGSSWREDNNNPWTMDGTYNALEDSFRVYYGGIDSVGVKDRARQLTTLMSNVAQRQAIDFACDAVFQDFFKPDNQRTVFGSLDPHTTPGQEGRQQFEVPATYADRGTRSLSLSMQPGTKKLRISLDNSYWDEENQIGNNVVIDRVRILRDGVQVATYEGEEFAQTNGFEQRIDFWEGEYHNSGDQHWEEVTPGDWQPVGWVIWGGQGWISFPFEASQAGEYTVEIVTYGPRVPANIPVQTSISLQDTDPYAASSGSTELREAIQALHALMLGEELELDDPEIEATYQLLVETWQGRKQEVPNATFGWQWPDEQCNIYDQDYHNQGWEYHQVFQYDPELMKGTWVSVIMYLMTHYNYLHE